MSETVPGLVILVCTLAVCGAGIFLFGRINRCIASLSDVLPLARLDRLKREPWIMEPDFVFHPTPDSQNALYFLDDDDDTSEDWRPILAPDQDASRWAAMISPAVPTAEPSNPISTPHVQHLHPQETVGASR